VIFPWIFPSERGELQLREEAQRARELRVAESQVQLERDLHERKLRLQQQSVEEAEREIQHMRTTMEASFREEV
jgi:hypothetical protein